MLKSILILLLFGISFNAFALFVSPRLISTITDSQYIIIGRIIERTEGYDTLNMEFVFKNKCLIENVVKGELNDSIITLIENRYLDEDDSGLSISMFKINQKYIILFKKDKKNSSYIFSQRFSEKYIEGNYNSKKLKDYINELELITKIPKDTILLNGKKIEERYSLEKKYTSWLLNCIFAGLDMGAVKELTEHQSRYFMGIPNPFNDFSKKYEKTNKLILNIKFFEDFFTHEEKLIAFDLIMNMDTNDIENRLSLILLARGIDDKCLEQVLKKFALKMYFKDHFKLKDFGFFLQIINFNKNRQMMLDKLTEKDLSREQMINEINELLNTSY